MPRVAPLTIRVPPRRSGPTSIPAAVWSTVTSPAQSLATSHAEVLKSLQELKDEGVRDVVVSVCAGAWGVEKGLIEEWLRENKITYAPPTPISPHPSSPDSSKNGQEYPPQPSTWTEEHADSGLTDNTSPMLFGQFIHGPPAPMQTDEIGWVSTIPIV